jgi:hypothetical protein
MAILEVSAPYRNLAAAVLLQAMRDLRYGSQGHALDAAVFLLGGAWTGWSGRWRRCCASSTRAPCGCMPRSDRAGQPAKTMLDWWTGSPKDPETVLQQEGIPHRHSILQGGAKDPSA